MICPKGEFIEKLHSEIRDIEAEFLDEVCTSVTKEPSLLPLVGEVIRGNKATEARLDVSAVGFWRPQERMFADVRIFDPNCRTYKDKEPHLIYSQHESLKKQEYGDRVFNVEHGTLTPLTGRWGKEVTRFHKQLANLIAEKCGESYNTVMTKARTQDFWPK